MTCVTQAHHFLYSLCEEVTCPVHSLVLGCSRTCFYSVLCMSCLDDDLTPCPGIWEYMAYVKLPACFNQEMSGFQVWHYLTV